MVCHSFGASSFAADYFISTQSDFDTYRGATFSPGDNIYFERGKSFTGMFAPTTVGSPGNVITISTYGSGARPVINNNGVIHAHPTRAGATVSAGVLLFNAEYVELRGLEVTNNNGGNQDGDDLFGIYVLGEDTGKYHNHIYIEDNYVHHVNGAVAGKRPGGIHLHGYSPTSSSTATYNNVRIVNNVVDQVGGVGIGTDIDDLVDAHDFTGTNRPNAITNLYVAHNWVGNTGRNTVIARDSDYAVYEYNTSANSSRHDKGHSFFNFRTLGMTWQYNEAYGNVGSGTEADRGGFDADYSSKDTLIQYNYSHSNDWFLGIMKRPNTNVTVRYNLSVNEKQGAYFYGFDSSTDVENVDIYNNTHYFNSGITPETIALGRTPHETTFNNNVFYAAGAGTMGPHAENGTNVAYDNNTYYNITPPASDANAHISDPALFSPGAEPYDVDMESGRHVLSGYMLSGGSPVINAGLTIPNNGGQDFWGNVVANGVMDIGANEATGVDPALGAAVRSGDLFPDPGDVDVIAATPNETSLFGDDATISLTQTFQVNSTFDLKTIFLDYEYDDLSDPGAISVNIEIFQVADVGAATIVPGTSLLTLNGLSMPELAAGEEAAVVLDSVVSLPARPGTAGYALRITNGGNPGFEWIRTGGSSGSVYTGGQAYENGIEKFDGERDFVLALISKLAGDYDGDGAVTTADYATWLTTLGQTVTPGTAADGNANGVIDLADYQIWKSGLATQGSASGLSNVPEPPAVGLLLIGELISWFNRNLWRGE